MIVVMVVINYVWSAGSRNYYVGGKKYIGMFNVNVLNF